MTYRLLPIQKPLGMREMVNTELMYDNLMNKMQFRELDNPNANLNEDYRGFAQNHRSMITSLADALILEGDSVIAKEVLDFGMKVMPRESLPYDVSSVGFAQGYFDIGEIDLATELSISIAEQFNEELTYMQEKFRYNNFDFSSKMRGLQFLQVVLEQNGKMEEAARVEQMFTEQGILLNTDRSNF